VRQVVVCEVASPPHARDVYGVSAARLASFGLGSVLVILSIVVFWGAFATYRAGNAAKRFSELSDAFDDARSALAAEESLERKYRLEPSPEVRAGHHEAANSLLAALGRARATAEPADGPLISDVLAMHEEYLLAIDRMFAAIDAGDAIRANEIDGTEVDPRFDAMEVRIVAACDTHRAQGVQRLDELTNIQSSVLAATPLAFAFGIGLVIFFNLILRAQQRRIGDAMMHEAMVARRGEKRFRALVQSSSDVVLICTSEGTVTYQSPTAETTWGYAPDGLVGRLLSAVIHPDDRSAFCDLLERLRAAPGTTHGTELRLHDAGNNWCYVELILTNLLSEPDVGGVVVTARDIAPRKAFEQQLIQQAFQDSLTLLPNRALFRDRLEQAMARAARWQGSVGLLYLDLDNFKLINDGLGHQAGDELLVEAAKRLQACVRDEDTVARLGGDEFVILLGLVTEIEAVQAAERIEQQFRRPFRIQGRDFVTSASIGVALGEAGHEQPDILLRNADVAMYRAKAAGRARHVVFRDSMQTDSLSRLNLESDLRQAVQRGELRVHYQPIVILETGRVVEVEALVRWQHPTRGLMAPADFIYIAEESGLIVPIGQWVLEEACRQVAAWQGEFEVKPALMVSVNLSPRQFQQPKLVEQVASALREAGLAPTSLKLEITEGVIMQDVEATIKTLWQLKELGVQLAIDDFGTGYSSLAYLKRLPLDILKIDRSFVNGIGQDAEDTAIVRAIISMAKSLHLSVTGEGIETAEQAALLRGWACELGQGYFFSRPLDTAALTEVLRTIGRTGDPAQAA
jgi:diguanylate cyclase (GGDEF)-like protein/PAS domain S-box-containing protein